MFGDATLWLQPQTDFCAPSEMEEASGRRKLVLVLLCCCFCQVTVFSIIHKLRSDLFITNL